MKDLIKIIKNVGTLYKMSDISTNKEVSKVISGEIRTERKILNNYKRGNKR